MVQSVELVFEPATEAAVRQIWDELRDAGMPAQPSAARPHVTTTVAAGIDAKVVAALAPLAQRFPISSRIGGVLVFGRTAGILARLIVPSAELLELHAEVHRLSADYLMPAPMPHTLPGDWTPHVTLARRIPPDRLADALQIAGRPAGLVGAFVGLRYWDGNARTELPIV